MKVKVSRRFLGIYRTNHLHLLMKLFYIFTFTIAVVRALVLVDSTLASACIYYDKQFDWGCASKGNGMKAVACRCGNVNWLGTITNCIRGNSDNLKVVEHAFKHVAGRCLSRGNFHYSLDDMWRFYENGTHYLRDPTEEDEKSQVFTSLRVNQTEFDWYYGKFKDFTLSVERSQWFGWGLVFYWVTIIALATTYNLNKKYLKFRLYPKILDRYLTIPPLVHTTDKNFKFFNIFLPDHSRTRLEVLVVAVFIVLTIISCGVAYDIKTPHPYLTSRWFMNLDILSYRVDLSAMSLFPVIYLFGIRNNPFIALTGLEFATFNYFHKWCAYVCVVLAFIHSIIWTVYAIHDGGYKLWWSDQYWQWGIGAMTLLGLLIFHSNKLLREIGYEVFLFLHKIMNILFIVCMYYHCIDMGWLGWIWSMAGILCFERVMRIARIILNGGFQNATLTYCGDSVIKMRFKEPKILKYVGGSYSFIYFVDPHATWYYPWQSHPFTLLTTPEHDDGYLVAYFKAKKGITKLLLEKLLFSTKSAVNIRVLIEGPYGANPHLEQPNSKLVGVAAGLGVTAIYSYFSQLAKAQNIVARSKFIWILRNTDHLSWFSNELDWLKSEGCNVTILRTKRYLGESSSYSGSEHPFNKELCIQNIDGRPDLDQLVLEELITASKEGDDIVIATCGPHSFNYEMRTAVSENMSKVPAINVDFKEESFTW